MIKFIKKILFGAPAETTKVEAPYKVEHVAKPQQPATPKTVEKSEPTKPANRKIRAVTEPVKEGNIKGGNSIAKKPATTAKPHRPYRGKPKAKK